MNGRRYAELGAALLVAGGAVLGASLLLLESPAGASTGLAVLVLGLVITVLGVSAKGMSSELSELLARTGYENVARLLEELGLQTRALYLPSAVSGGRVRALIPLSEDVDVSSLGHGIEDRLVVGYGKAPEEVGLLVATPGGVAIETMCPAPGRTVDEMTVELTRVVVSTLRIAGSVALHELGDRFEVHFSDESIPKGWMSSATEACIGSLPGSIAAALVAQARSRCVTIESEEVDQHSRTVVLLLKGAD
ncbi:MAG: hypothetical protein JW846_11335 [Dehalococcoidia bacterium]|nr:hypothetical protein [Dehalococcoidia bacterium]